jgi:hypothetical protein
VITLYLAALGISADTLGTPPLFSCGNHVVFLPIRPEAPISHLEPYISAAGTDQIRDFPSGAVHSGGVYGSNPRFPVWSRAFRRCVRIKSEISRQEPYFSAAGTDQIRDFPSGAVLFGGGYGSYDSLCKNYPYLIIKSTAERPFPGFQRCFIEKSTDTSAILRRITVSAR